MEKTILNGIPVVDLNDALYGSPAKAKAAACSVLESLIATSALIVRDPRVLEEDFTESRGLLTAYFSQPRERLLADIREEYGHQVGLSIEGAETGNKDVFSGIENLPLEHRPHVPPPDFKGDPKLRFFIRLRKALLTDPNDPLNQPPVIPEAFKDTWQPTMESWGEKLLTTGETVLTMIEQALGTEPGRLRDMTDGGPHLLGPNAADLDILNRPGTIINAFHRDLNLLSIHGPATYPGLRIWLRNGTSLFVKMPQGHILIQAGHQLEWLTGGLITAGMHEVIVTKQALALRANRDSALRISSPCFQHLASRHRLEILNEALDFEGISAKTRRERMTRYPPITVGEQVARELHAIGLAR